MKFIKKDDLYQFSYENLSFLGISMAGICTHITIPELKLNFDVGFSHPKLLNSKNYLITHAHMDHAAGIPYIISNKALTKQPTANFYMPPSMIEPMTKVISLWEEMEGHTYNYNFIANQLNQFIPLQGNYYFKAFKTFHRVESNGYSLFEKKKKLKSEFHDLPKEQLIEFKKKKIKIEEENQTCIFSFTGDTKIEFLDNCDWLKNSKVLMLEVTYANEVKSIAEVREWGHIHLDELVPRLKDINSEWIVLKHFSRRHSYKQVLEILKKKLNKNDLERVVVLPW